MGKGAADTARMTRFGMREAVVAPLKDFGLVKAKVPAILTAASEEVYKLPERTDCAYLGYEVAQLDLALGPDVDVPRDAAQQNLRSRGSRAASDAALDAVRDLTTGWIPFRSTVRRLTGAADNQDDVEDAVHAGSLRRAYLKGLGAQMGCEHPASPMFFSGKMRARMATQEPKPGPGAEPAGVPAVEAASAQPLPKAQVEVIRTADPAAAKAQAAPISVSVVAAPGG
jgi:hypothetical protein